tara:strand:+ start:171 stop:314 length:144 start_codon:yes stop_codon:yes gene_type:complete
MKKQPKGKKAGAKKSGNGKGDKPRSCFSEEFKNNYDSIDWGNKKKRP